MGAAKLHVVGLGPQLQPQSSSPFTIMTRFMHMLYTNLEVAFNLVASSSHTFISPHVRDSTRAAFIL